MATNPQVMRAVNAALLSTGAAAAALQTPEVLAQEAELEQIVVTGSRIRRVDAETASPVFTLDRSTIAETGVTTMGDLLQQIPSVSGAATNPQVNNGGGTGASAVELRGLGTQRTLVLLNGRRLGNLGFANTGADVNVIPTNLVERVEVLKEGAGALYGSDAVGGVVNFVTRTDFDGLEIGYEYGVADKGDGDSNTVNIAWGAQGERGSIAISGTYQKQEEISAANRSFTKEAIYFYTYVFAGGSSRTPTGRITLPETHPLQADLGCGVSAGSITVTRSAGSSGASPSRLPLLHRQRLLQLPALQPRADAAGARQHLHAGQLRGQRVRRGLRGGAAQLHDLGFPDRAAAVRCAQRHGGHPGRQRVQSVRHRLRVRR